MRRFLAIAVLAVLSFGPLAWLLPGSDDARLPICCRRHGAHRCSMNMASSESSKGTTVSEPSHCPNYSYEIPGIIAPFLVLDEAAPARVSITRVLTRESRVETSLESSAHSGRGPPTYI